MQRRQVVPVFVYRSVSAIITAYGREESVEQTKAILESISDGVFTVDSNWKITSFNRAAEEITGISREEAIGRECSEVFRSSMCETACALRESMASGKPVLYRSGYIVDSDGERIPVSVSTAVLRDENGSVLGGAETFRDLSEIQSLQKQLYETYRVEDFVSRSPSMQKVFKIIPAVASSPATVLIQGETGTGKEVLARAIHSSGSRSGEPFVAVNCGALPDTLLESELFGYARGAFTGAAHSRQGKFEAAGRGTLFLDEIGDVSTAMQVKLLRVLQEKTITPLGSNEEIKVNARIICASNKNLSQLVESGEFRQDLFYRINVVKLDIPPLRERLEDIPQLLEALLKRHSFALGVDVKDYDPQILPLLMGYNWPGNVRELENFVERAVVLSREGLVSFGDLPPEIIPEKSVHHSDAGTLRNARADTEKQMIVQALENNRFNRTAAAAELGIHKTTLYRRIKALGISLPSSDGRSSNATNTT
ncbi:Fis family transcriptional regulator [Candidatus Fermentibacteria bacterium]|nr:MAG: Fis family transcriptional regulator [Candidatus Fermentibacteria bacterium]